MKIKTISSCDAKAMSDFYLTNAEHLSPWEPKREVDCHSVDAWKERLAQRESESKEGNSIHFMSYQPETAEVIALCSLTNIVRGPFQACHMGYAIAEKYQGKGLMPQLCNYAIEHAFYELGLNRVMANYIPNNVRSAKLLERLGFTREGVAKKYLFINGCWQDHVLTSLINPNNS